MNEVNFERIIDLIESRRNNAYKSVNEELILLYLDVGKYLYNLQKESSYGDKITTKAAEYMKNNYPNIKGFTKRNIERMVQFYKNYKDDKIATPLVTQLSWTNNLLIISNSKSKDIKKVKKEIREELEEHNICHAILETEEEACDDKECHIEVKKEAHHHHHH